MWWLIVAFVATLVLAYAFMPKLPTQKPPGASEVTAPTAEVGRVIPVLMGERDIDGPNVTWYGDVRTVAIHAKGGKKGGK